MAEKRSEITFEELYRQILSEGDPEIERHLDHICAARDELTAGMGFQEPEDCAEIANWTEAENDLRRAVCRKLYEQMKQARGD